MFHSHVVSVLELFCECSHISSSISDDGILCHSSPPPTPSTSLDAYPHSVHRQQVTYRASMSNTPVHTAETLIGLIEAWVRSDPVIKLGTGSDMGLSDPEVDEGAMFLFSLDSTCPVRLRLRSQPLCEPDAAHTTNPETAISLPIFVASLVSVFLFCVFLFLVGVVCFLLTSQTRKHKV